MSLLSRLFALCLMIPIVLVTPCAFWSFNVNRVAMDPATYTRALETDNFYTSLLPAFIDGAANAPTTDPQVKVAFNSLIQNMSVGDWGNVSEKLVPANWLSGQIDGNIIRFFEWLDGSKPVPNIVFDLKELKANLSNTNKTRSVADIMIPRLPPCTKEQQAQIKNAPPTGDPTKLPLCDPEKKDLRDTMAIGFAQILVALNEQIPNQWTLADQLKKVDSPSSGPHGLSELRLDQIRAQIWLLQRMIALLFLIPLALLSIIIIVAIRSGKQFFRWLGWALIASAIITAMTWLLLPTIALALHFSPDQVQDMGQSGQLIGSLVAGVVTSITSALSYGLLIQIAIAGGIGFVAVALSILLPGLPPQVTKEDVRTEEAFMKAQFAAASTAGSTPIPGPTPTSMPTPPVDFSDIFQDEPPSQPTG